MLSVVAKLADALVTKEVLQASLDWWQTDELKRRELPYRCKSYQTHHLRELVCRTALQSPKK